MDDSLLPAFPARVDSFLEVDATRAVNRRRDGNDRNKALTLPQPTPDSGQLYGRNAGLNLATVAIATIVRPNFRFALDAPSAEILF